MSTQAQTSPAVVGKGLAFWRAELLKVSPPALAATGAKLKTALQEPDTSIRDLELIVAEDPVLSFQMLAKASHIRPNPDNDILSLPHAFSVLGMDRLRPLLSKVRYISFDPDKVAHNAFLQALNTSLHAAVQASHIAEQKLAGSGEAHYWIALRLSSVLWYLALSSPKLYHAIEQRVQLGESRYHVEYEILGCTTQELTVALLSDWKLSHYTRENLTHLLQPQAKMLARIGHSAWQDVMAPEISRDQGIFLQTPWLASVLAHWLALNTSVSWYMPKTERVLRMIATYLHRPLNEVITFVHTNAVICSREHSLEGTWYPAVRLLHPVLPKRSVPDRVKESQVGQKQAGSPAVRKGAGRAQLTAESSARNTTSSAASSVGQKRPSLPQQQKQPIAYTDAQQRSTVTEPASAAQTALFKLFYLQTVKQEHVQSIHQIMDGASQVMQFDLGLSRCILFMKSRSQGSVKGFYARGFTDNTPFGRMELHADGAHLFGKLLVQKAALWATPEQKQRIVKELPPGLWPELNNPDEFVVSSILLKGKVTGILYADTFGSNKALTQKNYQTFRMLAQAISQGMETLAYRKERDRQ